MDSEVKKKLVETFLDLEQIEINLFRSKHLIPGIPDSPRVYGGQIIGQALTAAQLTMSDNFHPHSLHCYFLSGADKDLPLIYYVDRIRDGRSFCNRFVKAVQNGVTVFTSEISFHKEEVESISHQTQMPDVPSPDELDSVETLFRNHLEYISLLHGVYVIIIFNDFRTCTDEKIRKQTILRMQHLPVAFDMRPVNAQQFLRLKATEPKYFCWIKVKDLLGENRCLHQAAAAFMSDSCMVSTALFPYSCTSLKIGMAVSLDHSIWFHRHSFSIDQWMLYETESTIAANSRALVHGRLWSTDKKLVLSTAQEVLIRAAIS
ncbi:Acyl-coenzyme A thioesterase 8 [Trichinella sp. T8]|nr:Acyl-coenzyme A thioesterase 8 [Trichinella sp. T8]